MSSLRFTPGRALAAVFVLALAVRLLVIATTSDYVPANDAADYVRYAESIASGEGFPESFVVPGGGPTATRPPGYPYFLGAIFAATGDSVTVARIVNAVLGAMAVGLIFLIAARIWAIRLGAVAGVIAALFPPLVFLSISLLTESLFLVFELGTVYALLRFREAAETRWALAAGLLAGLGGLTRANGLLLLLVAVIVVATAPLPRRRALATAGATALAGVLLFVPWTIRNANEFDRFIPVSTSAAFSAGTYNDQARADPIFTGGYHPLRTVPELQPILTRPGLDEGEAEGLLRDHAIDYALDHPGYVAEAAWLNALRFFEVKPLQGPFAEGQRLERGLGDGLKADLMRPSALLLLALAIGGLALLITGVGGLASGPWYLWAVPILIVITSIPVDGRPRYRATVDPFLIMLASLVLVWIRDRFSGRTDNGQR